MDNFDFRNTDNRMRIEGTLASMPLPYFKNFDGSTVYVSFVNVPIENKGTTRSNYIPIGLKESTAKLINNDFKIGDRMTVYGEYDCHIQKRIDENGNLRKLNEEYLKVQTVFHTTSERKNTNVGAINGYLYKAPDRIYVPGKPEFYELLLKVDMGGYYTHGQTRRNVSVNVTNPYLFPKLLKMRAGDSLAAKVSLKMISSENRAKLRAIVLHFLDPDLLTDNRPFDLDYLPDSVKPDFKR